MHAGYIRFLKRIEKKYKCNRVVHIGDLVDWNAISFHEKDPAMPGPAEEYKLALRQVRKLHKAFPKVDYMIGNHSDLPARKAALVGLPTEVMVPFKELWSLNGWTIHSRYSDLRIDDVIYRHGDKGKGGSRIAALGNAQGEHCSLVQGHLHSQFGVEFAANHKRVIWGMQVGCGVTPDHPAMKYSRVYTQRPILGCGVVINGEPALERMPL
jgi:hypothetical protein